MATESTPFPGVSSATSTSNVTITPIEQKVNLNVKGQTSVKRLSDLAQKFRVETVISAEGQKYREDIKAAFKDGDFKVDFKLLSFPADTLVAIHGHDAIILLFSEVLTTEDKPISAYEIAARDAAKAVFGSMVQVRNMLVVTPEDYSRAKAMVNYIYNSFIALSDPDINAIDINIFKDYQIQTSFSPEMYDQYVARFSPHGVPARADLKLCIYAAKNTNFKNNNSYFINNEQDRVPIAAVGVYVRFCQPVLGINKFLPEIHISEILCNIPTMNIIPFIVSCVTYNFLDGRQWQSQFKDFGGSNCPNIGNLFTNADGSPYRVENHTQFEQLISPASGFFYDPIIVLDNLEGRARVIGLEKFLTNNPEKCAEIITCANRFFGLQNNDPAAIPTTIVTHTPNYEEYAGVSRVGGSLMDSRWSDYLNLMIHNSVTSMKCRQLLVHYADPSDIVRQLRDLGQEMVPLYINTCSTISPEFVHAVQRLILNSRLNVNFGVNSSGILNNQAMLNASVGYGQNSCGFSGQYGGFTNYSGQVWH